MLFLRTITILVAHTAICAAEAIVNTESGGLA